jgi:hypothetical protein
MIVLEENGALGRHAATQDGLPRPAGFPYKRSPPAPVFCRQASPSFLSCVLKFLCPEPL